MTQELTTSGQEFLRHLWLRGCQADLVRSQVSISYADDWHLGAAEGEPAALGSLLLERNERAGGADRPLGPAAACSTTQSSDAPVIARPSVESTLVPLAILPGNRCDEHARGQATAPFTFRITLSVADTTTRMLSRHLRVQVLATLLTRLPQRAER